MSQTMKILIYVFLVLGFIHIAYSPGQSYKFAVAVTSIDSCKDFIDATTIEKKLWTSGFTNGSVMGMKAMVVILNQKKIITGNLDEKALADSKIEVEDIEDACDSYPSKSVVDAMMAQAREQ